MLQYLFVYGTLRKAQNGCIHPYFKDQAIFIDSASLPGKLYQISTYPGAVPASANSGDRVHGEVYRLHNPTQLLPILDAYEECTNDFPKPHEYQRIATNVTLTQGKQIMSWVYWFSHSTSQLHPITSGDYVDYLISP